MMSDLFVEKNGSAMLTIGSIRKPTFTPTIYRKNSVVKTLM